MSNDQQERIRQRAIQIWEAAGRPDGQHDKHWPEAEFQIKSEDARSMASDRSDEAPADDERTEGSDDHGEESKALKLAETTDLSPNQAKELLRKHGGDPEKVNNEAKNYKAES